MTQSNHLVTKTTIAEVRDDVNLHHVLLRIQWFVAHAAWNLEICRKSQPEGRKLMTTILVSAMAEASDNRRARRYQEGVTNTIQFITRYLTNEDVEM